MYNSFCLTVAGAAGGGAQGGRARSAPSSRHPPTTHVDNIPRKLFKSTLSLTVINHQNVVGEFYNVQCDACRPVFFSSNCDRSFLFNFIFLNVRVYKKHYLIYNCTYKIFHHCKKFYVFLVLLLNKL